MNTDITTGIQAVSAAGAVPGVLDTSAMSGDFAVFLTILGLAAGKYATIAIEDTANASAFSDAHQLATFTFVGPVQGAPITVSFRSADIPNAAQLTNTYYGSGVGTQLGSSAPRFGAANTKLRANVLSVDSSPGLSLRAYLSQ